MFMNHIHAGVYGFAVYSAPLLLAMVWLLEDKPRCLMTCNELVTMQNNKRWML